LILFGDEEKSRPEQSFQERRRRGWKRLKESRLKTTLEPKR
jgi:hypothetical protein